MNPPHGKHLDLTVEQKGLIKDRLGPFLHLDPGAVAGRMRELGKIAVEVRDEGVLRFFRAFIRASPNGRGIGRSRRWWKLMLAVFSPEEAIARYFGQFGSFLTPEESLGVEGHLSKMTGLSKQEATAVVSSHFKIRARSRSRRYRDWGHSRLW